MEKDLWLARVPLTPEMPCAIPSPSRGRSIQAVGPHTLFSHAVNIQIIAQHALQNHGLAWKGPRPRKTGSP